MPLVGISFTVSVASVSYTHLSGTWQTDVIGENKEFGLMQEGFGLKVVKLGENGITEIG